MGRIIQIDTMEVMKNIMSGIPVYMLIRCNEETTFAEAIEADAFVTIESSEEDEKNSTTLTEEQEEALDSYVINADDDESLKDALPPDEPDKYSAKKKKKGGKAGVHVDHGRIIALYRGGRSIKWIADDCGCSQQSVYNHLKMEGLK